MSTQFVWFTGHSAVGKRKIIDQCINNPQWAATALRLDVSRTVARVWPEKLDDNELLSDLPGCTLIKWQNKTDDQIDRLCKLRPCDTHIVILLKRDTTEHFEGFYEKFKTHYSDREDARRAFDDQRPKNENKASNHCGHVDRYMEILVEESLPLWQVSILSTHTRDDK